MSNPVNFDIDAQLKKAVKVAAVEHETTVSGMMREAIRKAEADPNTLVKAVASALSEPTPPPMKRATTSAMLETSELKVLDTFARKLATSRNSVIDLLLRATLSGLAK